jgi:hypothetical protein
MIIPLPPAIYAEAPAPAVVDWLVADTERAACVAQGEDADEIVLANGLVERRIRLAPNAATVALDNKMTGTSMIRAVRPEARVTLNGVAYDVGGLSGQVEQGYLLPEWIPELKGDPAAFQLAGVDVGPTLERVPWKRNRYAPNTPWPPKGVSFTLRFAPPPTAPAGVRVSVIYEIYDNLPVIAKRLEVHNGGAGEVTVDSFTSELLAAVEAESGPDYLGQWRYPNLHVETDYSFAANPTRSVHWEPDSLYTSQVDYGLKSPVQLAVRPDMGPGVTLAPGGTFQSFWTFVLVHDSTERERQSLAVRRMYRLLAPWVTENPILMHARQADPAAVRLAIDQSAEAGFEMVVISFWSGFDMENTDPAYLAQIKELVDHAHSKGIELGGYSLLASRRVSDEDDVVDPATGKTGHAFFGNSPCLGSRWGAAYFQKLRAFVETTGLDLLEHDGSYPGDVCASTTHPGHRGLADSQWTQWRTIVGFYQWCRKRGVYLNVPDNYHLAGSNKTAMGYRETNWSLPRARQVVLGRQNLFDGTWSKTPSMGWMFVPLVEYQGGGAEATLEPLREHLDAYEAHLAQNFGCGVQACYRGPRLFDSEETKAVVRRWTDFYRRHREVLDADIIHVRRADGRDLDCMLHANPFGREKGLAMVWNPLPTGVTRAVKLPLYYTGLSGVARIRERDGEAKDYTLARDYTVEVPVTIPARGLTWLVIE